MSTVLEEVTSDSLSREHVERRVNDWVKRIDDLYATIRGWLSEGWSTERSGTVTMEAHLMRDFGVPARELPMLTIMRDGRKVAFLEPRGLWIIGANGRIDLHCGNDHYIIVDKAENFAPPDWRITVFQDRLTREPFNRDKLRAILDHA